MRKKRQPGAAYIYLPWLAGLLLLLAAPASAYSDDLSKAMKFFDAGDYASVLDKLKDPDKMGKERYIARYYRGLALQKLKQNKKAIADFKWLYYNSRDKNIQYKAWQALKNSGDKPRVLTGSASKNTTEVVKNGPGANAWVTPTEGYGRSGPAAYSRLSVQRYAKPCGH